MRRFTSELNYEFSIPLFDKISQTKSGCFSTFLKNFLFLGSLRSRVLPLGASKRESGRQAEQEPEVRMPLAGIQRSPDKCGSTAHGSVASTLELASGRQAEKVALPTH